MRASLATVLSLLSFIALLGARPSPVRAGGYELLPGGTQSVARGGAIAARPEDGMMLEHDPAGLSLLSGQQLLLNYDLPLSKMCVDSYGYYGWGVYQAGRSEFGDQLGPEYAKTPLPQVCNSGQVVGIPHLVWAGKLTDDLGVAAGFVAPTVVTQMQYGGADGTIETQDANGNSVARPTPTRYSVVSQQVKLALAPSIGVGYRLMRQLQLGLAAQVTMIRGTTRVIQNLSPGTQPSTDWLADLDAHDYFIPSLTFSVHSIPALDLMAAFHWSDKFNGSGKATYETSTFQRGMTSGPIPARNFPFDLSTVQVGLPWTLTAGARYAGLLSDAGPDPASKKERSLGDPMDRDLWDVEIDATYSLSKPAATNKLEVGQDVTLITREAGGASDVVTVKRSDVAATAIDRHLKDSIAVRVGGSFSVIPRTFALQAGAFFETRGIDPAYASVDVFAFQRVGLGGGVMARLGDFDLVGAYGHIFEETLEVAPPPHQNTERAKANDPTSGFDQRVGGTFTTGKTRVGGTVLGDPSAPSPANADAVASGQASPVVRSKTDPPNRVVNAGKYTAAFNVISIGAVYHF
jgi:hypothetical protein